MNEILEKTLVQMPDIFTSNMFSKQAEKNGYPRELIVNGHLGLFLHKNCKQGDSKRTWFKIKSFENKIHNQVNVQMSLEEAIKIVKANGFKVMKQNIEWIEL